MGRGPGEDTGDHLIADLLCEGACIDQPAPVFLSDDRRRHSADAGAQRECLDGRYSKLSGQAPLRG